MRSRALAGLVCLAVSVRATNAMAAPQDAVAKGPYLQHLSSTSVEVRVELRAPAAVTVDVTPDASDGGHATAARSFTSQVAWYQSVHVDGLAPATRYTYVVHVAGSHAAPGGTFVTAPDASSHQPFTFVVYGDDRSDGAAHARVAKAMAAETFDFLIQTGDLVVEGADEAAWQSFFDIEEPILCDRCLWAALGNHELHSDRAAAHFERYFDPAERSSNPAASQVALPLYGTFRWGRARFYILNAFEDWGGGKQRPWLEQALALGDHEPGIDLRVAVFHHGPYSAGPHGNNQALLDAHIDDLLVAHHVDLVLSGHDHIYERGQAGALKYIVSGGAGAPLYRDITPIPSTRKVEATYHYVLATVTDEGVAVVAKRPDGSVVDQCSFARGGSWLCDAPKPDAAMQAKREPPRASVPAAGGACGCEATGAPLSGGSFAGAALSFAAALGARRRARDAARRRRSVHGLSLTSSAGPRRAPRRPGGSRSGGCARRCSRA